MTNKQKQEKIEHLIEILDDVYNRLWDLGLLADAGKIDELQDSLGNAHASLSSP